MFLGEATAVTIATFAARRNAEEAKQDKRGQNRGVAKGDQVGATVSRG